VPTCVGVLHLQVHDPMMRNLPGEPLVPPVAIVAAALGVRLLFQLQSKAGHLLMQHIPTASCTTARLDPCVHPCAWPAERPTTVNLKVSHTRRVLLVTCRRSTQASSVLHRVSGCMCTPASTSAPAPASSTQAHSQWQRQSG
jgi:hypothetical protein